LTRHTLKNKGKQAMMLGYTSPGASYITASFFMQCA
jgi:hypothetical protein